ncbi:hypothetical protein SNE40_020567 [Patella caerulea]|uniref:SOCS box domain-containing protein n=1 Tax=Patella caerulea TaxID=87958 RepID=A0AAN8P767_PATCE
MSECEPEEFWRKSHNFKKQLIEAVNKNDTAAVERFIQEGEYDCLPYWMWLDLCEVALKNRCLPMVDLLLSSDRIPNSFVDVESNTQLIKAAIKSDFIEGVKYLQSKGIPLYLEHSMSRYNWSPLTECVMNNSVEVLKYLLELKYLDKNPDKGETLIMLCCHELKIDCLEVLLKSELVNTIDQQSVIRLCSYLRFCIGGSYYEGDRKQERVLDCVKLLVESGADVSLKDINGTTPIQMAAERGMVTTVTYLAERGANLDLENKQGNLLHTACRGNDKMVKSLIKSHCDINIKVGNNVGSVILASIRLKHTTIAEILIQAGCDVNGTDRNGVTPLMECIKADNLVLLKQLIDQSASVNAQDNEGTFVLDYLCRSYNQQNSADIVKIMIEAGADIHKCNNLLCRAINRECYESASLLIEQGIDVNTVNENGDNPLVLASEKGKSELVKLLTIKDCDINHQNLRGETALHKAIKDSRNYSYCEDKKEIIKILLLQNRLNVNLTDVDGQTALFMAVINGERSITEDLLKAGADVNHCDNTGKTPLMMAVNEKDTVMANILLKAGADLKPRDRFGRNAIYLAALFNVSLDLDVLLKYSNVRSEAKSIVNATDKDGKTPFMVAAEHGFKDVVEKLLTAGCNIDLQDHGGKTALMFAVHNEDETILSLLLQNGADYNICDNNGQTAFITAAEKRNKSILECLLNAGADVNQSNNHGTTALMAAARTCNRSILECLLNAGADVNKTDTDGRSAIHGIMVGSRGSGRKWINCLKLLLINKCHPSSLDTPGEDRKTLFQWLLGKNKEDLIWYLVTENCSLKGLDLPKVKEFQFPDILMLSKILFESGAPKSEIEVIILLSDLHTGFSLSTSDSLLEESDDKQQLDDFRGFCKSRSLKSRCRREIRNCIGPGISSKITQVGLPKYLQDYVVMKDLIPEKYFTLVIDDQDDSNARTDNIAGLMFALMASRAFPIYGGYDSDDSSDSSYYEPEYYSDNYYYDSSD